MKMVNDILLCYKHKSILAQLLKPVKAPNLPKAHQTGHQSHAAAKSPCDQVCFIPSFAVLFWVLNFDMLKRA